MVSYLKSTLYFPFYDGSQIIFKLIFVLVLSAVSLGVSNTLLAYSVTELAPVKFNTSPDLKDNDKVVWVGLPENESDFEIYYYDGSTSSRVTNNSFADLGPKVNDSGMIVWYGGSGGYKVFSNVSGVTNLSGESDPVGDPSKLKVGLAPAINNLGHVAWFGKNTATDLDDEIYYYDGSTVSALTANEVHDYAPRINDKNEIVWLQDNSGDGSDWDVYFSDGSVTSSIESLSGNDFSVQINNATTTAVVWRHTDTNGEYIIRLWDGATLTTISDDALSELNKLPQINDSNQVVWQGLATDDGGADTEIFLYKPGVGVQRITDNDFDDFEPQINNNGVIAWRAKPENADSEVYIWNGGAQSRVTSDDCNNLDVRINDNNSLVWVSKYGESSKIIFAADNNSGNPPSSIDCTVSNSSSTSNTAPRKAKSSGGCALNTQAGFDPVLLVLLFFSFVYLLLIKRKKQL